MVSLRAGATSLPAIGHKRAPPAAFIAITMASNSHGGARL
jgi:hypothetical protein